MNLPISFTVHFTCGHQATDELVAVSARLPDVGVRWQQPSAAPLTQQQRDDAEDGAEVDAALSIAVTLQRHGRGSASTRVYAPHFPKVRLTLGFHPLGMSNALRVKGDVGSAAHGWTIRLWRPSHHL